MDPFSVTLAVLSFASFLKDIVELGLIVKGSIDKIGRNQKRLRDLAADVLYGLQNLERYYREHNYILDHSTGLATALRGLHRELLVVRDRCQQITSPARGRPLSLLRANVKAWTKRDDIEADIIRLKEHINCCYLQFIAFASARIEYNQLVHRVEDQVRLNRVEGLVTRWLVETHANHSSTDQISGSTTTIYLGYNNIEYQFLRLQIRKIIDLSANVAATGMVTEESMELSSEPFVTVPVIPRADDAAVHLRKTLITALQMLFLAQDNPAGISIQDWAGQMLSFASSLYDFGMPEVVDIGTWVVNLYRILVQHNAQGFMPYLAMALHNSSNDHAFAGDMEGSLVAIQDSHTITRLLHDTYPSQAYKQSLAYTLRALSRSLSDADAALAYAKDSLSMLRELTLEVKAISSARNMPDVNNEPGISLLIGRHKEYSESSKSSTVNPLVVSYETALSLRQLSYCLASAGSNDEAYAAQQESLDILLGLSADYPDIFHVDLAGAQYRVFHCMLRIGKKQDALSELEKAVVSYRLLAQRRPLNFTIAFIKILSIYATYLRVAGRDNEVPAMREEAVNAFRNLVDGPDSAIRPDVFRDVSPYLTALGHHDEAIAIAKGCVDICRHRFRNTSQTVPPLASDTTEFIDAISTYATLLRGVGRKSEALAVEEEALQPFRQLVECCPDQALDLPSMFVDHSSRLRDLGRHEEAIAVAKEGADFYRLRIRNMPQTAPSFQVGDEMGRFVDALCAWAALLQEVGRDGEALSVEEEALQVFRKIANHHPDQALYIRDVFGDHSSHLQKLGRHEEAIAITKEGADFYRLRIRNMPQTAPSFQVGDEMDRFVDALCAWAALLQEVGRDGEALGVEEEALQVFRKIANHHPDQALYVWDVFRDHSSHLRKLGRHEEAIAITKEGADFYRLRIRNMPQTAPSFRVGREMGRFVDALCAWAALLQEVGRDGEALSVEEEALQVFRKIANHHPDQALYVRDVFRDHSSHLRKLGRHEEAIAIAKEGTNISQLRICNMPETMLSFQVAGEMTEFVNVLCMYITLLQDVGRDSEALAVEEEALDTFRNFVNDRPDLALASPKKMSLNLPSHLLTSQCYDEAVAIAKKGLDIYCSLIRDIPEMKSTFTFDLSGFAHDLYLAQQWADSLAFYGRAVNMVPPISSGNSELTNSFVRAHNGYANGLYEAGDVDTALSTCEKAVEVICGHVGESPDHGTGTYAWVYLTQAKILYSMSQYNEALVASEGATTLFRTAPVDWEYLGGALSWLSHCQLALGRAPDALAASEEAVKILQGWRFRKPGLLAHAGNAYSKSLATLGRITEALAAIEEAEGLCRKAYQENPCTSGAFDHDVADIIHNFSIRLSAVGRLDDALANNMEAVEIYRKIVSTRPGFYPELAKALHSLSIRLSEAGRHDEALMNNKEAAEIYRKAVVTRPGRSPELAKALQSLSIRLWEAGRRDEAVDACHEIVDIRQRLVVIDSDSVPLLREAQDNLAARMAEMDRLAEPSAGATQDTTSRENPAVNLNSMVSLKEVDTERDVEAETGSSERDAFDTSFRLEKTTFEALTVSDEDSNAEQVTYADIRGAQTSNDSLTDTGLTGLTDFISSISIPKLVWDHLRG